MIGRSRPTTQRSTGRRVVGPAEGRRSLVTEVFPSVTICRSFPMPKPLCGEWALCDECEHRSPAPEETMKVSKVNGRWFVTIRSLRIDETCSSEWCDVPRPAGPSWVAIARSRTRLSADSRSPRLRYQCWQGCSQQCSWIGRVSAMVNGNVALLQG